PEVVLFGDSITQSSFAPGWGSQLADWYTRRADVINRGFSGYNTRMSMFLLNTIFPQTGDGVPESPPALLVTVFLGANDMALASSSARQHVPLQEYKSNLKRIVAHIRAAEPGARIILITPPPVHEGMWREAQLQFFTEAKAEPTGAIPDRTMYARACKDAAGELGIPAVDAFSGFGGGDPAKSALLLSDGLHLSAAGNSLLFGLIKETVRLHYPALLPEQLKMHAPLWSSVDPKHPEKQLSDV
ncbi:unnamed protein product, partial [Phaeothamnion confervicola]